MKCRQRCRENIIAKALDIGQRQFSKYRGQQENAVANRLVPEITGTPVITDARFFDNGEGRFFDCAMEVYIRPTPSFEMTDARTAFAENNATSPETLLRLHGSNTIGATLAPALAEHFLRSIGADDIRRLDGSKPEEFRVEGLIQGKRHAVEIHAHGSSTGFRDLLAEKCDIAMASRKITPEEVTKLSMFGDMTAPASEHVVALDGIAVIVHPANPIDTLTIEDLSRIFSGEITDWSAIGGPANPIALYARDDDSGTYDTFRSLVLGKKKLVEAFRFDSNTRLSDSVARDPAAIGFTGLPYIRHAKAIAISDEGTLPAYPTVFTVATEDYPLSRRLYLYTPSSPANPHTRLFADMALSYEGQEIAGSEDIGFVNLNVFALKPPVLEASIANDSLMSSYLNLVGGDAKRLSLSFRFKSGSQSLDNRALRDMNRIVDFLNANRDTYDRLILTGFTDNLGDYRQNHQLALQRARRIEQELYSRGIAVSGVLSAGEEMPVASNRTEAGREKNRRVEIWVK